MHSPIDGDALPRRDVQGRIVAAAIEAELATGEREATIAQARARIVVRLARMAAGTAVLVIGAVMLVLPGPGWLVIAVGLGILARDVAWAERALAAVRRRLPSDADGRVARGPIIAVAVMGLGATALSVWWSFA